MSIKHNSYSTGPEIRRGGGKGKNSLSGSPTLYFRFDFNWALILNVGTKGVGEMIDGADNRLGVIYYFVK